MLSTDQGIRLQLHSALNDDGPAHLCVRLLLALRKALACGSNNYEPGKFLPTMLVRHNACRLPRCLGCKIFLRKQTDFNLSGGCQDRYGTCDSP